jgi:hypothetical protein
MGVRHLAATRRSASAVAIMVLVAALIAVVGQTIARAQGVHAGTGRPAQGNGTPNNFNSYDMRHIGGYSPYPVKDPTADERAVVAGRVYRAVLDEWLLGATRTPRSERAAADIEARTKVELAERLGPWSLRWQEAQDNAARSRADRYQAMSDHLGRMSALADGRLLRETGQAIGGPAGPRPVRGWADVARFFRPIDDWGIDRIIPALLVSERPLNPQGVAVTSAEQVEIAGRVYQMILEEAVDRVQASPPRGETRSDELASFDGLLAERLAFWSDLWRQSQDLAARDRSLRSLAVGGRPAGVASAGPRAAGLSGPTATMRSHYERMSELENGRFVDNVLKRAGRSAGSPVDVTRFPEFVEAVRFFRIEADSLLSGATKSKGTDATDSGQAATAGRIYRAILDGAARRYRKVPRAGQTFADLRLVFDPRTAERLAAWSVHWARAEIRTDTSRVSQFNAVRSHAERMASLEDGRSLHDALDRAGADVVGVAAPAPRREFADVARFCRLEALWELAQVKSR